LFGAQTPIATSTMSSATFAARTAGDAMALMPAARDLAARMGQGLVAADFRTQAGQIAAT